MAVDTHLITYIQDHLAGARFALALLEDLAGNPSSRIASTACSLLTEIEQDRLELEQVLKCFASEISYSKEFAAWIAQKASRLKLSLSTPFGQFEAIETLAIGVSGKIALWRTLQTSQPPPWSMEIELSAMIQRARAQHRKLEHFRIQLAKEAFRQ